MKGEWIAAEWQRGWVDNLCAAGSEFCSLLKLELKAGCNPWCRKGEPLDGGEEAPNLLRSCSSHLHQIWRY